MNQSYSNQTPLLSDQDPVKTNQVHPSATQAAADACEQNTETPQKEGGQFENEQDPKVYETVEKAIEYIQGIGEGDDHHQIEGADIGLWPVTLSENPDEETRPYNIAIQKRRWRASKKKEDQAIEVINLEQRKVVQTLKLKDPDSKNAEKALEVYRGFSQIQKVKLNKSKDNVPVFLAISGGSYPDKVFACPYLTEGQEKPKPFKILDSNSDKSKNFNLKRHSHVELHLKETYALITAAKQGKAIIYKIDISQGIEQATVIDQKTFDSKWYGYRQILIPHSVMKDDELYFFYNAENLVKINGLSFKVIQQKKVQNYQEAQDDLEWWQSAQDGCFGLFQHRGADKLALFKQNTIITIDQNLELSNPVTLESKLYEPDQLFFAQEQIFVKDEEVYSQFDKTGKFMYKQRCHQIIPSWTSNEELYKIYGNKIKQIQIQLDYSPLNLLRKTISKEESFFSTESQENSKESQFRLELKGKDCIRVMTTLGYIHKEIHDEFESKNAAKAFIAEFSSVKELFVVVACTDGCLRVYQWNDWRLIYKTIPLSDEFYGKYQRKDFHDAESNFHQHPVKRTKFKFYEFIFDLSDLLFGIPEQNIFIKRIQALMIGAQQSQITPEDLIQLENFVLLPSKLNASSLIKSRTLTNDDPFKVIPHLVEQIKLWQEDSDMIVLLDDQRGHILERLKSELLQVPRKELGQGLADLQYTNVFTQEQYLEQMFDLSMWLPDIYENNIQNTVVWDDQKQKLDKIVAQIVIKTLVGRYGDCLYKNKAETSVFSTPTKNISMRLLKQNVSFKRKDALISFFDYKPQEVEVKTFAQPYYLGLGSNKLEEFFNVLSDDEINKKQAFESDNAQLIELIWNENYYKVVLMYIITRVQQLVALMLIWNQRTHDSLKYGLITLGISLFFELIQVWAKGFLVYFFVDTMNYIDLLGYIGGILWISAYFEKSKGVRDSTDALNMTQEDLAAQIDLQTTEMMRNDLIYLWFMLFWSFTVLIRGLDLFLLFTSVRNDYVILVESFKDSKAFMIIVSYLCFVFGVVNSLLLIGDQNKLGLLELVLNVFQESLGGFSPPEKDTIKDLGERYVYWTLFTLLLIITNIIGFNSLIAVIGDSYERVQTDKAYYDAVQKFTMLRELNDNIMFLNKIMNREIKADPRFVHIVKYADDSVQNKEWQGRIESIKEVVQTEVKSINKRIDGIDEKLQMLINKLN